MFNKIPMLISLGSTFFLYWSGLVDFSIIMHYFYIRKYKEIDIYLEHSFNWSTHSLV